MDLLLTHGYFLYEDPKELQIMKPYPPLGLLYICSHLREKGVNAEAGHDQGERNLQRQPGASVVFTPVANDGMQRQKGQDDEKKADHLIPQSMNRFDDLRHHMAEELFCR